MSESATYVYAIVKSDDELRLGRAPSGLPGMGRPRVLPADGYALVVSTAPLARWSAEKIDQKLRDLDWVAACGAAHEAVVEHAARAGTVVPMKLFTLFASDARAIADVKRNDKKLGRVVARIRGCDEWGLRVLFDEARAAKARSLAARARAPMSGTGFLERKKDERRLVLRLTTEAKSEVEALFERLERASKKAARRAPPSRELEGRVLLDAVFLVPRKGAAKFKDAVRARAEKLAGDGYHVTLSGPWPAYNFIEAT